MTWKHGAWKSVVSVCVVGTGGALGSVLSSVATGSVLLCLPGSIRRYSCPPSRGKLVLLWVEAERLLPSGPGGAGRVHIKQGGLWACCYRFPG